MIYLKIVPINIIACTFEVSIGCKALIFEGVGCGVTISRL